MSVSKDAVTQTCQLLSAQDSRSLDALPETINAASHHFVLRALAPGFFSRLVLGSLKSFIEKDSEATPQLCRKVCCKRLVMSVMSVVVTAGSYAPLSCPWPNLFIMEVPQCSRDNRLQNVHLSSLTRMPPGLNETLGLFLRL